MARTYLEIDRPYSSDLERGASTLTEQNAYQALDSLDSQVAQNINTGVSINSPSQMSSGAVEGDSFSDVWINTWIKSRNYQPKARGFYINGAGGYIECVKLFVGTGGIVGGSLDIPNELSSDSWHVDSAGNMWSGANVVDFVADNDNATAYILKTGVWKLGASGYMGDLSSQYIEFDATSGIITAVNPEINQALPKKASLISHLSFDENTGTIAYDSTSYENHLTIYGASYTTGITGSAILFDANTEYLFLDNLPTELQFATSDSFFINMVISTSMLTEGVIIDTRSATNVTDTFMLLRMSDSSAGRVNFVIKDSSTVISITGTTNIADGNRHSVIAVRDATDNKIRLYIDGQEDNTEVSDTTTTDITNATSDLTIGKHYNLTTVSFAGTIEFIQIFSGELTDAEAYGLAKNYNGIRNAIGLAGEIRSDVTATIELQSPVEISDFQIATYTMQMCSEYKTHPDNWYFVYSVAAASSLYLYRIRKNTFGSYIPRASDQVLVDAGATYGGVVVIGSYVYVSWYDGTTASAMLTRYDLDLTNGTAMTLASFPGGIKRCGYLATNGTSLYIVMRHGDTATAGDSKLYTCTISGTTATYSAVSANTIRNSGHGLFCNETNFFTVGSTGTIYEEDSTGADVDNIDDWFCAGTTTIEYPMGIVRIGTDYAMARYSNTPDRGTSNTISTKIKVSKALIT